MQVTEKLARYIIGLQGFKQSELGLEMYDNEIKQQLEAEFPILLAERDAAEFSEWVWAVKVEEDGRVEEVRARIARWDAGEPGRGDPAWLVWNNTRGALIRRLQDVKGRAFSYLMDDKHTVRLEYELRWQILSAPARRLP